MKMTDLVLGAVLVCACGGPMATQPKSSASELLARFESTALARDAAGRSALFTADAVVINAFGERVEGTDALTAFWKGLYGSGTFDGSKTERLGVEQRELAPGMLLVDYVERLTGQRGPNSGRELPPRTIHITLILEHHATGWLIAYYRAGDVRLLPRRAAPDPEVTKP